MKFKRTKLGNYIAIYDGFAAVGSTRLGAALNLFATLHKIGHPDVPIFFSVVALAVIILIAVVI